MEELPKEAETNAGATYRSARLCEDKGTE